MNEFVTPLIPEPFPPRLSPAERVRQWNAVASDLVFISTGPESDEEHPSSFSLYLVMPGFRMGKARVEKEIRFSLEKYSKPSNYYLAVMQLAPGCVGQGTDEISALADLFETIEHIMDNYRVAADDELSGEAIKMKYLFISLFSWQSR